MNKRTISRLFLALFTAVFAAGAAILMLAACTPGYGVFSEIQTEKAQVGTDVFKNATVKALGEDGTNYYAVMAKVFYRTAGVAGSGAWKVLSVNGSSDYFSGGFASDGASIYVAALDSGSSALQGIYKGTTGGTVWSAAIGAAAFGTESIDALFWAGTNLFALTHSESTLKYSLFYFDGSTAFASTGLSGLADPILGVVYDSSAYWAVTRSKVYTGTAVALTTESTPAGGKTFGGIAVDSANKVLVTTTDGYIYSYSSGWSAAAELDAGIALGALVEVPINADAAAPYRFIVAKNDSSYGYFEYDAAAPATIIGNDAGAIFAPASSSYTTTVYQKPVQAIHYSDSGAEKTLLIGLAAQGTSTYALYSNSFSGGAWSGWTAE